MAPAEVHMLWAELIHSRLWCKRSDSVGRNSTGRKTECVFEGNAKGSEEPDCPCSETKHSGSFIHERDKERTWLKNMPQKSIGQYQMNHHFSLARDRETKVGRWWFLHILSYLMEYNYCVINPIPKLAGPENSTWDKLWWRNIDDKQTVACLLSREQHFSPWQIKPKAFLRMLW